MFVQTKLNPAPTDPVQAKMFTFMPLIFTFMFAAFPAGLVIYWTWNNLLSVTQQYVIMRREGVKVHLFRESEIPAEGLTWPKRARIRNSRANCSPGPAISSGARATSTACRRKAWGKWRLSAARMSASPA